MKKVMEIQTEDRKSDLSGGFSFENPSLLTLSLKISLSSQASAFGLSFASLSRMASFPRYFIVADGSTFHVTWQCHNKDWLLKEDWAKKLYYALLLKFKSRYGVKIHSYSFMDNHPHLTGTLSSKEQFSAFFRVVNSLFAKTINKRFKRRGQVVMDRFKSPRIETDRHLLEVMIYIDLNPFRARKVKHPKEYQFSSYGYYAHGKEDLLLDPPETYLALGKTPDTRQRAYREMVESVIKKDGDKKRDYSHTYFIGNPNWVVKRHKELTEAFQFKRRPVDSMRSSETEKFRQSKPN